MLIKFGDTIINLDNVTVVVYEPGKVSANVLVPGGSSSATVDTYLKLSLIGGGEQKFSGISAERLWAKLVSLVETVTVPPGRDQES